MNIDHKQSFYVSGYQNGRVSNGGRLPVFKVQADDAQCAKKNIESYIPNMSEVCALDWKDKDNHFYPHLIPINDFFQLCFQSYPY